MVKLILYVSFYPKSFRNPEQLANLISEDFDLDIEKAGAVYSWITKNVSYDYDESGKYNYSYRSPQEHIKKERKYQEKLSKRVISRNKAVCEGYAKLFKKVCDHLKITCFYISGKSKTEINDIGERYSIDHAWNIIEINNKKYLIDATWGAGYYDDSKDTFIRKPNYLYFGTKPEIFVKKHYPDFLESSLMKQNITKDEFSKLPLSYDNKASGDFTVIYPLNGILNRKKSSNQVFIFKYAQAIHKITYHLDGKQFIYNGEVEFKNGNIELEIKLSKTRAKELIIFFDYEPIAGFKIK